MVSASWSGVDVGSEKKIGTAVGVRDRRAVSSKRQARMCGDEEEKDTDVKNKQATRILKSFEIIAYDMIWYDIPVCTGM